MRVDRVKFSGLTAPPRILNSFITIVLGNTKANIKIINSIKHTDLATRLGQPRLAKAGKAISLFFSLEGLSC